MTDPVVKLIILAFFAILITLFIYSDVFSMTPSTSNSSESFIDIPASAYKTARVSYEFDEYNFPSTIFETSLSSTFDNNALVPCQVIPTLSSRQCSVSGNQPIVKYKFPVSITKLPNGKIAAVFNDGRIYLKDKLTEKLWQGPLKNSFPDRIIPLRAITLNPESDRLVGIGYDNRVYIKTKDPNAVVSLETEWIAVEGLSNVIYLMYEQDTSTAKINYMIINTQGQVVQVPIDNPTQNPQPVGNVSEPILKLYYDPEGYMLALDTRFNLRTFDSKDWKNAPLSSSNRRNKSPVLDVLYDKDQLLFGLVIIPETGMTEVMKQEDAHFMSPFIPLDLNKYVDSSIDSRLTERTIMRSKMGIIPGQGLIEEEALDDDVNVAYQRQLLEDKKRLREFCSARSLRTDTNYKNYDVLKNIDDNAAKIDKLNQAIKDLISFDPDQRVIKESVLGLDFITPVPTPSK